MAPLIFGSFLEAPEKKPFSASTEGKASSTSTRSAMPGTTFTAPSVTTKCVPIFVAAFPAPSIALTWTMPLFPAKAFLLALLLREHLHEGKGGVQEYS